MFTRIIGESQRRIAFAEVVIRVVCLLGELVLTIERLRKIEKCFRVGDLYFFFRPFVFSDLLVLFSDSEPYVKKVFQPQKGETVFDVGAHIGIYTLKAAKKVGDEGIVVAFEPDDENFRLLQKNVQINGLKNVKLIKAALGKNNIEKVFYMHVDPSDSSLVWAIKKVRETKRVQVVTLDRIVENLKITRIDWIKIDVEGGEMDVLEGGKRTFTNFVNKVIIETYSKKALRFFQKETSKLIGYLTHIISLQKIELYATYRRNIRD